MRKLDWDTPVQNDNDSDNVQLHDLMDEDEVRKMMHYSKRDLILMLAVLARGIEKEEAASTIYRIGLEANARRAEEAEAERDMYKHALETVCILLDDTDSMVGCARSIALSPFAAKGESMEDLRRKFGEEVGA